jgi:hypothetical protein
VTTEGWGELLKYVPADCQDKCGRRLNANGTNQHKKESGFDIIKANEKGGTSKSYTLRRLARDTDKCGRRLKAHGRPKKDKGDNIPFSDNNRGTSKSYTLKRRRLRDQKVMTIMLQCHMIQILKRSEATAKVTRSSAWPETPKKDHIDNVKLKEDGETSNNITGLADNTSDRGNSKSYTLKRLARDKSKSAQFLFCPT